MQKTFGFFFLLFLSLCKINAQKINIEQANELALKNSDLIKVTNNNFLKSKIGSKLYKISLLPIVSTTISLPYQRSISEVLQQDGSQKFIERNYLNSILNLNISQVIPFTGGSVNMSSSLNNARDFNYKTSTFSSNWVNLSYQQNINGYNSYKWDKKLNELNLKKDSITYLKEKIKLKYDTSKLFADTQLLQVKSQLLKANIEKTEKLAKELDEKYLLGRVLKTDLNQIVISLEQLKRQYAVNILEYNASIQSLLHSINYDKEDTPNLEPIEKIDFEINLESILLAIKNNGYDLDKTIRLLQSEANIDKVKKEGAITVNLQLGMGLNSSSSNFNTLYSTPTQSQFVSVNTKIPILDWGKNRNNYAIAKLDDESLKYKINQEEKQNNEQANNLYNYHTTLKLQLESLKEQLQLSEEVTAMFEELMPFGRKTITEYKTQQAESFTIAVEYQKTINDLYLLKLKVDEINCTLK